jgi:hypothetical protein
METTQTIADTVRKALDQVGYAVLAKATRFSPSMLHRSTTPERLAVMAHASVARVYAAATEVLKPQALPKSQPRRPHSTLRKSRKARARR